MPISTNLAESYDFCQRLARREAGNFYHAFRILPRPQRRSMCALYAFMRVTDDLADGPESLPVRSANLATWRAQFEAMFHGTYAHALHPAFHDTIRKYSIPRQYLDAVLDGVCMDLTQRRYETFQDLYRYCYQVASVVGLACIHIWGFQGDAAKIHAEAAGVAFQLTNILRDLREDGERGRIYLPLKDLHTFGYAEADLLACKIDGRFLELMRFQVDRAHHFYELARPLSAGLEPEGKAIFQTMIGTYRGLLEEIERRNYDVFSSRVRLGRWRKLRLVLRALPVRWGWA